MKIGLKIAAAFFVGLLMITALGITSYRSIQRLIGADIGVTHTHEVLEDLAETISLLQDAETGQRGFIITGEESYLEPYSRAEKEATQKLNDLAALTAEDPEQQQSLTQLRTLADSKLAELRETIALRNKGGLGAAIPVIRTDRGKQIMDDIRAVIERMRSHELELLAAQTRDAKADASRTSWTIILGVPLSLLVLALSALILTRHIAPPLTAVAEAAQKIAQGELPELPGEIRRRDEVGVLQQSFHQMTVWLRRTAGYARRIADRDLEVPVAPVSERDELGKSFSEMVRNLRVMTGELTQRSEDLSQTNEELLEQSEELSQQNEELQSQAEEIQSLNAELERRETLLQKLLRSARQDGGEQSAMDDVCRAAMEMFGEVAAAVVVYEAQADRLIIRAIAAPEGGNGAPAAIPVEDTFSGMVIGQSRTACLNDTSLRPDLSFLKLADGEPFQAVICAPMIEAGAAFGAVTIYSREKQEWTVEHFRLAQWLARECSEIISVLRLQESLRRQAALIDLSPDGILVRLADGTITLWAHGAELLYGWTKADALGRKTHETLKSRFPQPIEEIIRQLEQTGRWTGELTQTTKSGREIVVHSRWLGQRNEEGIVTEILECNVDITAHKLIEEKLSQTNVLLEQKVKQRTATLAATIETLQEEVLQRQQAEQRLKSANVELDERAGQLRELAGELTLSAQRERQRLAKILHDHLQQLLVGAKFRISIAARTEDKSVRKAMNEIDDLLSESIDAARSLTSELSPPALHEGGLKAGLEWLARWMSERHGLTVDLASDTDIPPLDEDVKVLLFESVRELLFNVVKHSRVQKATVAAGRTEEGTVFVSVIDGGCGFDPGKLKPGGRSGGGFGLFSVRERLEMIGGTMEIQSIPGEGSRFTLAVPPGRAEAKVQEQDPAGKRTSGARALPHPSGSKIRILLADDHAVMREGLARLLAQEPDFQIVGEATDGHEAVELAGRLLPDLILMDVSMPRLNGVDATRSIHREFPDIRIIGLSMYEEPEQARTMLDAGAVDYLNKSGDSTNLIHAIRGAVPARKKEKGARSQDAH